MPPTRAPTLEDLPPDRSSGRVAPLGWRRLAGAVSIVAGAQLTAYAAAADQPGGRTVAVPDAAGFTLPDPASAGSLAPAAIVGGIAGALVLAAVLFLLAALRGRRARRREEATVPPPLATSVNALIADDPERLLAEAMERHGGRARRVAAPDPPAWVRRLDPDAPPPGDPVLGDVEPTEVGQPG